MSRPGRGIRRATRPRSQSDPQDKEATQKGTKELIKEEINPQMEVTQVM